VLFVVRHAEKVDESENARLSSQGMDRARRLATLLRDARIDAIYTSLLDRAILTATPLAEAEHLRLERVDGRKTAELVARIKREHPQGRVLVVGHSNTIPELLAQYGLPRPPDVPPAEYDNLWILTTREGQHPEVVRLHF
jgi:broad specificity phosphatase PhoE